MKSLWLRVEAEKIRTPTCKHLVSKTVKVMQVQWLQITLLPVLVTSSFQTICTKSKVTISYTMNSSRSRKSDKHTNCSNPKEASLRWNRLDSLTSTLRLSKGTRRALRNVSLPLQTLISIESKKLTRTWWLKSRRSRLFWSTTTNQLIKITQWGLRCQLTTTCMEECLTHFNPMT